VAGWFRFITTTSIVFVGCVAEFLEFLTPRDTVSSVHASSFGLKGVELWFHSYIPQIWLTNGVYLSDQHISLAVSDRNIGERLSDENMRERITIRLTKRYMHLLDRLVERGVYNSRNEALRDALRLLFEHHGLKVLPEK
jgi:hypothetical protein